MKVAHIILAHTGSAQVRRLIVALRHPDAYFFVHVDKKCREMGFQDLEDGNRVFLVKNRVRVVRGGYGTIGATLHAFREILESGVAGIRYVNVISGKDYPLRNASTFLNMLKDNIGSEFIEVESIRTTWHEGAVRFDKYSMVNYWFRGRFRLQFLMNRVLPKRKFPLKFNIVGRSNWFTITLEAAQYILEFLKANPKVNRYFWYVWGADEMIFSTILFNSPFRERIRHNLVYVDWNSQEKGHPRILDLSDFDKLVVSGKYFARKFNLPDSAELMDALDERMKFQA